MELYIEPERLVRNPTNGRMLPGFVPHNKGKRMKDYASAKSCRKMKKNLSDVGRKKGAKVRWAKYSVKVIRITDGQLSGIYDNASDACRCTGVWAENIRKCCNHERRTAGGSEWFWETDERWIERVNG